MSTFGRQGYCSAIATVCAKIQVQKLEEGTNKMKNSKKALLIGLGATAAIAAIAAALAYEEEAVDKIGSYLNRQRMKNFVKDHLKAAKSF